MQEWAIKIMIDNQQLWDSLISKLKSVCGALAFVFFLALDFIATGIGGFNMFTQLLLQFQLIDIAIGTYASIKNNGKRQKKFSSHAGIRGLDKKMMMWFWIWLAYQIDTLWGLKLRDILIKAYCTLEIVSIAELWVHLKWFGYEAVEKGLVTKLTSIKKWVIKKVEGGKSDVKDNSNL